jgi:4-hydroxybenzoate polyprenyltransferase
MDDIVTDTETPTTLTQREDRASAARGTATLWDYVELVRPTQWIKNIVVFAGPAAGLKFSSATALQQTGLAFAAFCLAASATYAINDVMDRKADASHPTKRNRPVARGAVRPATAMGLGYVLAAAALALSILTLNHGVTTVLLLYFALTLAYSVVLKQKVLLDVIIVAIGFVLRAWAGSMAVGVVTSEWLVACVFTLCLFMGFGKRRCELAMITDLDQAGQHRRTLVRYTPQLLTHLITVSAGIAVITFLLYTLDTSDAETPFHKQHLFYTLPLVVYGVFRFAMHTELGIHSGPTEIVLKDRALLLTILTWTIVALAIAYQEALVGPGGFERLFGSL